MGTPEQPQEPEILATPSITLECVLGVIDLTWFNTIIRKFSRDPLYDHVEYYDDEGLTHGIIPTTDLMQQLNEFGYSLMIMPYVDEKTKEWFVKTNTDDLQEAVSIPDDWGL